MILACYRPATILQNLGFWAATGWKSACFAIPNPWHSCMRSVFVLHFAGHCGIEVSFDCLLLALAVIHWDLLPFLFYRALYWHMSPHSRIFPFGSAWRSSYSLAPSSERGPGSPLESLRKDLSRYWQAGAVFRVNQECLMRSWPQPTAKPCESLTLTLASSYRFGPSAGTSF